MCIPTAIAITSPSITRKYIISPDLESYWLKYCIQVGEIEIEQCQTTFLTALQLPQNLATAPIAIAPTAPTAPSAPLIAPRQSAVNVECPANFSGSCTSVLVHRISFSLVAKFNKSDQAALQSVSGQEHKIYI